MTTVPTLIDLLTGTLLTDKTEANLQDQIDKISKELQISERTVNALRAALAQSDQAIDDNEKAHRTNERRLGKALVQIQGLRSKLVDREAHIKQLVLKNQEYLKQIRYQNSALAQIAITMIQNATDTTITYPTR